MARLYTQKSLKKVAVIMEAFAEYAKTSRMPGWEKIVYVPDAGSLAPAPREESRAHYSLSDTEVAILCFGALTQRKGVEILLNAAAEISESANIVVFLAGKQDPDVELRIEAFKARQEGRSVRIVIRNAFVDSDEERRLFAAADIVWVGYPGFLGSSGVLIQAGCASLPVVSGSQGETGATVGESRCGLTCDLMNPSDVAAAVRALVLDRELRVQLGKHGAQRSERHSPRIFGANIFKLIEETAGMPASSP
jgi:glycosyltransferase involved in cell wall biosynthesis